MRDREANVLIARTVFALLIAASLAAVAGSARAQDPLPAGTLSISVRDSLGRSIAGAELTVEGTTVRGVTDERGELRFTAVRGGPATVRIRRLGFVPASVNVIVDQRVPATSIVMLTPIPQRLAPIIVRGANNYTGRMAGFYQRRDLGIGHFVSREKLEHDNPSQLTDVFRRLPGVQITSTRFIRNAVRFRGNSGACWPLVWLDGAPLPTAEFDLDFLSPQSVEGIEVYSGISQVPPQFMGSRGLGSCGVIVVWSREGERRQKKPKKPVTATQLAEMVASLKVYTPDQVDVPARSDSLSRTQPQYPETLLFTGVPGQVLAEFVVDTLGHVELDTFGVISSTNPKFTQAVQRVLPEWAYAPAMLNGRRVRQLVQQPFSFVVDSSVLRRSNRQ
jgi:TonB-dependent Receptor Plug Domain/Carboxypeptidase regulatory-like domain/Gram-negative bacterial TonB protein C-terminal